MVKPLALPQNWPTPIKVIFSDIDDTLTWEGRLPAPTFMALQQLRDAGVKVVPVTGACGGWADCIVRTWPLDTLIAENGSFWLNRDDSGIVERRFIEKPDERTANLKKLHEIAQDFRTAYPMIDFTQDQDFRLSDIAFDIGQHVEIDRAIAEKATQWWWDRGITARCSSIHINVWIGSYNKASTALKWLRQQHHITLEDCLFIGDSLNDDSMFEQFPQSIGVANIAPFLKSMSHPPRYLCENNGGYGFCELARSILSSI